MLTHFFVLLSKPVSPDASALAQSYTIFRQSGIIRFVCELVWQQLLHLAAVFSRFMQNLSSAACCKSVAKC